MSTKKINKKYRKISIFYSTVIVITITIIVIITTIIFIQVNRPEKNIEIYSEYYKPFEISFQIRDSYYKTDAITNFEKNYSLANYIEAIKQAEIIQKNDSTIPILFLAGIAYMELKSYDKALKYFNTDDKSSPFYEQIIWYKSLCYIRLGQTEEAKELLKMMVNTDSDYKRNVNQIINEL